MNKNLKLISKVNMSREAWLQYRNTGIGGSDIGSIMMLNKYMPRYKLYEQKIGLCPMDDEPVERMFHGTNQEEYVAKLWSYWDGTKEGMMDNYAKGKEKVFRKVRKLNSMVINPDYPYFIVNVDYLINKDSYSPINKKLYRGEGVLECKIMSGFAAKMWEDGVPPSHVSQVTTYVGVLGCEYGELATLTDGNNFDSYHLPFNAKVFQSIVSHVEPFVEKIRKGKALVEDMKSAIARNDRVWAQEIEAQLQANEPEADDSEACKEYLSHRYKVNQELIEISGGLEDLEHARRIVYLRGVIKEHTDEKTLLENKLRMNIREGTKMVFHNASGEPIGKITWNEEGERKTRTLRINMK